MTQRLAGWAADVAAGAAGSCGCVTGGIVSVSTAGAGVVVDDGAARITSVAPPKAPPPQRPLMV
jgi:hypothetical protein